MPRGTKIFHPAVVDRDRQAQNTGLRSQVSFTGLCFTNEYRNKPKHSIKLTLDLIRPKQEFLGLRLALS